MLPSAKQDTLRAQLFTELASLYQERLPDSCIYFGKEIISIGLKIKDKNWLATGYGTVGHSSYVMGNYPLALQMTFKALDISESLKDSEWIANTCNQIGNIYKEQQDYKRAIPYYQRCKNLSEISKFKNGIPLSTQNLEFSLMNLGYVYEKMNETDSALYYDQQAYNLGIRSHFTLMFGYVLENLGTVHAKLGQYSLAESYLRMAIDSSISLGFTRTLSMNYLSFGRYCLLRHQTDSAILYAKKALSEANKGMVIRIESEADKFLSELYKPINRDSAFAYQTSYIIITDSLFNRAKIEQVQNLNTAEKLHQEELAANIEKEKNESRENLQNEFLALAVVGFIFLFLLLSHTIIVSEKIIRFLSIIVLLIVFEFLNLLLHPFLDNITHHESALMLAAMVCIAGLLIPLHHKLEHWITHQMVEKNKKIRLAAAKKTIQQLEGK
ncbi:MAG: hypothetical protein NVS3B19_18070 [Ginsengibacter sp.]